MFCTYCGQKLDLNNECQNNLCSSQINNTSQYINGFSKDEIINFTGNNAYYYLNEFLIHNEKSKFISWNFSSFFFHWIWMFYRRMNLIASIYLVVYLIGLIFLPPSSFIILSFTGHILCGLLGNSTYRNHCFKKITSIRPISERVSPSSYTKLLQFNGGTSTALAIFTSLIYSFILIVLLLLCISYDISYLDYPNNYAPPSTYGDEDELPYWYNTPGDFTDSNGDSGKYI